MKKVDFIGIDEQTIYGVKNPLLHVHGKILKDEYEIEVHADNKIIEYQNILMGEKNMFMIESLLPRKTKIVKVYVIADGKKYLICKLQNRLVGRILRKLKSIAYSRIKKISKFNRTIKKGLSIAWKEYHFLIPFSLWGKYYKLFIKKIKGLDEQFYNPFIKNDYAKWILESEKETIYEPLKYKPKISVIIPVYNVSRQLLSECLDSVLNQKYDNFEICLADDNSTNIETIQTLKEYEMKSELIKVVYRKENGHISNASNSALQIADGEYIAMMDNDDIIPENALYEMVKVLNQDKKIDMIYTDEDKIDLDGKRCEPNFKSDYAPDSLLSSNYFCHFTLLRTGIVKKIGGWRVGYEGAQDYDLFLRFTEKTNNIYHLPKILYHWRKIPGSTSMCIDNKDYAIKRGKKALEDALKRRKIDGIVHVHNKVPYYFIEYKYKKEPLISIIIPTRDYSSTLEVCLKSIYEKTTYKNFEIIVANNNSCEKQTYDLFDKYKKEYENFKVIDINTEFNYSDINNKAFKKSSGEYIVLLNNDTEVITPNWLEIMVGYAMQNHIGAVGAKLLYPDKTIQHGGVILGLGGVASHAFINCLSDDVGLYGRLSVPYNYSAVTAACLMVSRKKYNEVNGLNKDLKVAYNDIDFNIRLMEKGYYNVFVPMVELIHFESKSRGLDTTSEKYKRFLTESNYMYDKWSKLISKDPFYNPNLSLHKGFMLDPKTHKKS